MTLKEMHCRSFVDGPRNPRSNYNHNSFFDSRMLQIEQYMSRSTMTSFLILSYSLTFDKTMRKPIVEH
jgi:hypothetical protein